MNSKLISEGAEEQVSLEVEKGGSPENSEKKGEDPSYFDETRFLFPFLWDLTSKNR